MRIHLNTQATRLPLMLAGLGLAGCVAVGPDYVPPATDVPTGWSRLDASAQPVTRAAATGDLSQWWQALNDPLLSDLIAEAQQGSPDLRSAQARVRQARARRSRSSEETGSGDARNAFSRAPLLF